MASDYLSIGRGGFVAGGDLSGTSTSQTVVSLTGSGGIVTGPTTALKLGTTPASAGLLRMPNSAGIYLRNAANTADVIGIYLDSGDLLYLGNGIQAGIRIYQTSTTPITINAAGWQWSQAASSANATITQTTRASDAACADTTLSAQSPFSTATGANRKPGDLYLQVGSPTNGGTSYGRVVLKAAGNEIVVADKDAGGLARFRMNLPTGTSSPSAGGAGALPATPAGYVTINVNGTDRQVAYY